MRFCRLLLLGCLLLCSSLASSYNNRSDLLGLERGLNNATVYRLFGDIDKFLWLTTDAGLSRFDGYHFRNYPLSSPGVGVTPVVGLHDVRSICESGDGLLFFQLAKGGIACFDTKAEQYLPVNFDVSFDKHKITSLCGADQSLLYIGTTTGLYSAEVKQLKEGETTRLLLKLSKPILTGHVSKIVGDGKENLFLCIDDKQVVQYSMGTQQTKAVDLSGGDREAISALAVFDNYLFVCSHQGAVLCYQFKQGEYRLLRESAQVNGVKLSETFVTGIAGVDQQTFYLSTLNGIYCLTFESEALTNAPFQVERISSGGHMTDVYFDASHKTLWASSYGGGIEKIKRPEYERFRRILLKEGVSVKDVEQDAHGYIWLTTLQKGVWKSTSPVLSPDVEFEPWQGVDSRQNYCIYKDRNNGLWLGDEKAEVTYVDPATGSIKKYQLKPEGTNAFASSVKSIYLDRRNRLWVSTSEGLVLLDRQTGNCSIPLKEDYKGLEVYSVVEDSKDNLWVGTGSGVKRLNMLPGKVELTGDFERMVGVEPTPAYVLYLDMNHNLFVAYADKVVRIDIETEKAVSVLGMPERLKNGRVNQMVSDPKGNIWMGCNSGISVLRKDGNILYNDSELNYVQSVVCLKDGRALWGTSRGMLYYTEEGADPQATPLFLSDVWVNGKSVTVGEDVGGQVVLNGAPQFQKQLVLDASRSSIGLYFTDLQYGSEQQPVAYRLLPDEDWQMGTLAEGIWYDGLPVGNYTLQVKLIYPTGEGTVLELPIEIVNSWWASPWMCLAYAALVVALLFAGYRYYRRKEQTDNETRDESEDSESSNTPKVTEVEIQLPATEDEELLKRRSDYNIIHVFLQRFMEELRTPLSVTKVLLKEVGVRGMQPEVASKLMIAYRNSIGALNACELLIDIYKQGETGNELRIAAYSPVRMADALLFSMSEFLRVYSVKLEYQKAENMKDIWVDRNKVEFLLRNLLSNAFIHIRYVGNVELVLSELEEEGISYCVFQVSDNGKCAVKTLEEMTKDELLHEEALTMELGLDVMQDIVRLHHGTLQLQNDPEIGTTLILKLPTDKDVFANDSDVTFVETEELDQKDDLAELSEEKLSLNENETLLLKSDSARSGKEHDDKDTLLIVEDYPDIRLYLKVLFEKEYNVLLATNGVEGVALAKKELPDLIICDIMMPLKNGYECCKEIKEGLDTCHIPFIMLTAKIEDEDVVKGLETGADDYILKPFTPSILKARVKSLIQGRVNLKQTYSKLFTTPAAELETQQGGEEQEAPVEDPFISMVIKIVEENIQQPDFSVKKLASDLNMSQPTLYRKVKQYTDFTIIELIRGVRLRKAAALLQQKCYAVQEVAEMVGYNDIPTFRKHFVDMFGTTPSTYASAEKSGKAKE